MTHRTYKRGIAIVLLALIVTFAGCSGDTTADAETTTDTDITTAETTDQPTQTTTVATTTPKPSTNETTTEKTTDPSSLSFGDTYIASNGMQVTIDELEFVDSYGEGWEKEEPADGKKFLFVTVTAENMGDRPTYPPDDASIVALSGNQQFNSEYYWLDDGQASEWTELQPGIVESGIVVFEVDEDLTVDDIDIVWSEQYYTINEDAYARWS